MKTSYESRSRFFLPRRSYTIIRIDGKAFHTFTRGLKEPFDDGLMDDMDLTAAYLCKNIMGAKFAFVQSDEISILLTDFEGIGTQAWFDNNLQKMSSVSASMATKAFNEARLRRCWMGKTQMLLDSSEIMKWAEFDSRIFQIPQKIEVENYFIWRQQDTTRNSIQSVAQSLYSHKDLNNKNSDQLQEMVFQKGTNWNDYASKYKRGRMIVKELYEIEACQHLQMGYINDEIKTLADENPVIRSKWVSIEVPIFTQERQFLTEKIPNNYE